MQLHQQQLQKKNGSNRIVTTLNNTSNIYIEREISQFDSLFYVDYKLVFSIRK